MVVIVTTVCNIFGDWFLIYPMAMGTKGAAIATGISQTIGLLIILVRFARKRGNLRFGKTKLNAGLFRDIIVHGLPEGISQLATPVMTLCMNFVLIQRIGDLGVNAFSVISYIASFSMAAFFGASEGLQPLFGQSYGAKNEKDLKFYFKAGLSISAVGSAVITVLAILLGKQICGLFGADATTTEYVAAALPQFAVGFIITAVNVMISAYLYSTERSALSTSISILRSLIINSAVILILPHIFGDGAIWFSLLVYESIVLAIAYELCGGASNILSVLLIRGEWMPCRIFVTCKQLFNLPQYCFYKMKPEIAKQKHNHKEQQERSHFSNRHFFPHFVAKRFIKKSVKAASSSSCDT